MYSVILSIIIIFLSINSLHCIDCDSEKLKGCQRIIHFDTYEEYECCVSHYKNGQRKVNISDDEICTLTTVYCCRNRGKLSFNRCEKSLENLLSKTSTLSSISHENTDHTKKKYIKRISSKTTASRKATTRKSRSKFTSITETSTAINQNLTDTEKPIKHEFERPIDLQNNSLAENNMESSGIEDLQISNQNNITSNNIVGFNDTELKNIAKLNNSIIFNNANETQIKSNKTASNFTFEAIETEKLYHTNLNNSDIEMITTNLTDNELISTKSPLRINKTTKTQRKNKNVHSTTQSSFIKSTKYEVTSTTSQTTTTTVRPMKRSEIKCAEYGLSNIQKIRVMGLIGHKPREVTVDKCRHKAIPLVVGGREAMPYEFPHQALLGYDFNDQTIWKCGGSLVSRNFILTAAHCIYDFELGAVKVVKLGAFNQFEDTDKTVLRNVIEHIEHPDFDRLNLIDDIGLLKLDDFVPLNEFINPACLPIEQTKNTHAVAIGFGATETSLRSKRLMKVVLEKFEPWYPQRIRNHTYVDKFIFYGHRTQRRDTCSGDSGSPLQVSNDMNVKCSYTQVGIVSYGPNECGIPEVPAVYVNVFYYKDWIERYIWVDEDRLEQENDP